MAEEGLLLLEMKLPCGFLAVGSGELLGQDAPHIPCPASRWRSACALCHGFPGSRLLAASGTVPNSSPDTLTLPGFLWHQDSHGPSAWQKPTETQARCEPNMTRRQWLRVTAWGMGRRSHYPETRKDALYIQPKRTQHTRIQIINLFEK